MDNELQQIDPRPCEVVHCHNVATWTLNGIAVCYEDMQAMSSMNGDNAEVFASALVHVEEE